MRAPHAVLCAALLASAGCGPSTMDRVRSEAHGLRHGDLALACPESEIEVEPEPTIDPITGAHGVGAAVAVGRYRAFCAHVGCCGRDGPAGLEHVSVSCRDASHCEVTGDTLGACLTVYCATFRP